LNVKGVREKKLQESLRKLRFSIKMKKSKKPSSAQKNGEEAVPGATKANDVNVISKPSETAEQKETGHAEASEAKKEELENTAIENDPDTGKKLAEAEQGQTEENQEPSSAKDAENDEENHHLFEDDHYEQAIVNAVWSNKQMPKRRKHDNLGIGGGMRLRARGGAGGANATRGVDDTDGTGGSIVHLDSVKSQLLEIEALYTSTMNGLNREWDAPDVRE